MAYENSAPLKRKKQILLLLATTRSPLSIKDNNSECWLEVTPPTQYRVHYYAIDARAVRKLIKSKLLSKTSTTLETTRYTLSDQGLAEALSALLK